MRNHHQYKFKHWHFHFVANQGKHGAKCVTNKWCSAISLNVITQCSSVVLGWCLNVSVFVFSCGPVCDHCMCSYSSIWWKKKSPHWQDALVWHTNPPISLTPACSSARDIKPISAPHQLCPTKSRLDGHVVLNRHKYTPQHRSATDYTLPGFL